MAPRGTTAISKAEQRGAARHVRSALKWKYRLSAATRCSGPCKLCALPPFPGREQVSRGRLCDFSRRPQDSPTSPDDPGGFFQASLSPAHQKATSHWGVIILYIPYDPAGNPLTMARLSDSRGHGSWRVFSGAAADEDKASASETSAWGIVVPNPYPCLIFFLKVVTFGPWLGPVSGLPPTAGAATTSGNKEAVPPGRQSAPG